jgi:hypothetical protein
MTTPPHACHDACAQTADTTPNLRCACSVVDVGLVRGRLPADLPLAPGTDAYAGLFSPYALFVEPEALDAMAAVARAVFEVARNAAYVAQVLTWAPAIARVDPGSPGGVLGLDFHLTVEGPRVIEINTNPGGLLLNAQLLEHVASCAPARWHPPVSGREVREAAVKAWVTDLAQQREGARPRRIAIVDEAPQAQFLYPEFVLYAAAFGEHGIQTVIRAPGELGFDGAHLIDADGPLDAVYNRLTDFGLHAVALGPIASAYLGHALALSPHPRAHALFADKRNLVVLGHAERLGAMGVPAERAAILARAVPVTRRASEADRAALWSQRAHYFFKPAAGYGSRGSYRGDKLSRRTWDGLRLDDYIAQTVVPPSLRVGHGGSEYKVDVRCYASIAGPIVFAARLYQGQTTNMRTAGGGFAAVLTRRPDAESSPGAASGRAG